VPKKLAEAKFGELSEQFLRVLLAAAAVDGKSEELVITRKAFHDLHQKLKDGYNPEIDVWFEDNELHIALAWSAVPIIGFRKIRGQK
jgi:hypothetical protein